jgi:dimeric dUTPase (all-alpha-NTP-PPase superfamily)
MENNLKSIFDKQKSFQLNFYDPDNMTEDQKIALTKEFILCMHRELGEVLNIIPWKLHRKNSKQYDTDELKEEVIDCFKYLLNLCLIWGLDADTFEKLFFEKSNVVEERYNKEKNDIS